LPAWLGTGAALDEILNADKKSQLDEMLQEWPYFKTLIDMLEMVLSKSDGDVAWYYEAHLTNDPNLHALGNELRQRLQ
ncbi:phosphoenolpyruvate carboxylase, partial [Pseudomonas syringae]